MPCTGGVTPKSRAGTAPFAAAAGAGVLCADGAAVFAAGRMVTARGLASAAPGRLAGYIRCADT